MTKEGNAIAGPRGRGAPHPASACSPSLPCCCAWCSRPDSRTAPSQASERPTKQGRLRWPNQASRTSSSFGATTSAGGTSATTAAARWATGPQHRPHRQRRRDVHRLLRPAKLHRRPRRLHHRPEPDPHRPDQGRDARRRCRPPGGRPDHRGTAEAAGLRHRPVRQEPSGRQGRISAHGARLRRVLRQPLSPQCRGGAGGRRTIRRTRHSSSGSDPEACCTAGRTARADRRSRIPVRSPRSAWRRSTTR